MKLVLLLLLVVVPTLCAQDWKALTDSARADLAFLTSQSCKGRGYLPAGDRVAADYIRRVFRAHGVAPGVTARDFDQPVSLRVHLFPATPQVVLDGASLGCGAQFLPHPECPAGGGATIPYRLMGDTAFPLESPRGSVVIINEKLPEEVLRSLPEEERTLPARIERMRLLGAVAVFVRVPRLVHSISENRLPIPVFMLDSAVPVRERGVIDFNVADTSFLAETSNIVGVIRGTRAPDSAVVVCAHYDHLGALGDVYFPGANDNASGTAMLLAMARSISRKPLPYTVVLLATTGEEAGLHGSMAFVRNPPIDLAKVRFLLNIDMTASGADGVMAQGGVENEAEFALLQRIAPRFGIDTVRKRANSPNSDQYFFLRSGVRGFYLYPFAGLQPYHSINDRPETLEWNVWTRQGQLVLALLRELE